MRSVLVLCVVLDLVFSIRAASLPPPGEAVLGSPVVANIMPRNNTSATLARVAMTLSKTFIGTGLYDDRTPNTATPTGLNDLVTPTTTPTTPYPTSTVTGLYDDTTSTTTTPYTTTTPTGLYDLITLTTTPTTSPTGLYDDTTSTATTPYTTTTPTGLYDFITPTTTPTTSPTGLYDDTTFTTTTPYTTTTPTGLYDFITPITTPTTSPTGLYDDTTFTTMPPYPTSTTTGFYDYTTHTTTPYPAKVTTDFYASTYPTTLFNTITTTVPDDETTFTLPTVSTTPNPPVTSCGTQTTPITQSTPSPGRIMCPEGWTFYHGRCYYFVNDGMTWAQALSNCANFESVLVTVQSSQEYSFLQQLTANNEEQEAWLGGFYLQDQWLWIDGSWFYNNSWNSSTPYSSYPCLMLNAYDEWNNIQCSNFMASICAKYSDVPPMMFCPDGWSGFHGRCYYYNQDTLTWPEADAYCAGLQASLVSVHTPEEYFFLYQLTNRNIQAWLGGFYLDDQWLWLDGSWFHQGFSSLISAGSNYSCLATSSAEGWSNYECDQSFASFCVRDPLV